LVVLVNSHLISRGSNGSSTAAIRQRTSSSVYSFPPAAGTAAGIKTALVAAVPTFVAIVFLSCRAGFGSRVLFRVSTRPVPIPVNHRESDRVGLGLSRLAPVALPAVLAVNRVDQKRFGAADAPRHGCVHFSVLLVCE
jgi:hypothetical protein